MKFLTERSVAPAIKKLVSGQTDVRIAVAFWGKGASEQLGLEGVKGKPRILCNLDSGACNPKEIGALRSVSEIRTNAQLHAKVYWTPDGVILGSSNASSNGLWGEGSESRGWHEANVLIRNQAVIAEVGEWFDKQWKPGRPVTSALVKAAQSLWEAGRGGRPPGLPLQITLTEAYRTDPDAAAWKAVFVAVYDEDLSMRAKARRAKQARSRPILKDAYTYEGWTGEFKAGMQVIDVDGVKGKPVVSIVRVGDKLLEFDDLTYLLRSTHIEVPGVGHFRLTPEEKEAFGSLVTIYRSRASWQAEGGVLLRLAKAMSEISRFKI